MSNSKAFLRRPTTVDIRGVWPSEPADFTPWLAENLDLLDALEIGTLTLVGVEHSIAGSGRSLDVLAENSNGDLVAIENQFGVGDHDHLTRGLVYAVGCDARYLVVIAERHLPEFRRVAEYLNGIAEDRSNGIGVFLVEVSVEQVGVSDRLCKWSGVA